MTLGELATHWRVPGEVAQQAIEPQKAAGLIETETNRSNLETLQKWRLSASGHARVETARARTWYAGPLPVSLADYEQTARAEPRTSNKRARLRASLDPYFFEDSLADEVAQSVAAGASLALGGVAPDEQHALAAALHAALEGSVSVPVAIFAAGAVMRVLDPRVHHANAVRTRSPLGMEDSDLLRTRETATQWADVSPPLVTIAGGVLPTDVIPAFDADARFYLAPAPLVAAGGLLAVCDAASSDPAALDGLARNWMVPARRGEAVLLLRTGERIEVPWRASLIIFAHADDLPPRAASAVQYALDASGIGGAALRGFLAARLGHLRSDAIETVAELIERTDMGTRTAAAAVAQYLNDAQLYRGAEFSLSEQTLSAALQFAATRVPRQSLRRAA